jgi:hypothetical protein
MNAIDLAAASEAPAGSVSKASACLEYARNALEVVAPNKLFRIDADE